MLTSREKSPLPENIPRGGSNPRRCGQRAQTQPTSYSGPFELLKSLVSLDLAKDPRLKLKLNPGSQLSRPSGQLDEADALPLDDLER